MSTLLYPLKFTPILKEKIWGGNKLKSVLNKSSSKDKLGESWEISGIEGDVSVVKNGFLAGNTLDEVIEIYMSEIVGEPVFNKFNKEFPLLFKFIDANQDLSIQVHPNDELSKERHNAYGKTEMWYIIDTEPESQLISGFTKKTNKEEYLKSLKEGTLTSLLKAHDVKPGYTFFIPAGDVHAIGAGVLLAEIQQTSDVTYRIYDYDRKDAEGNTRELHTELAVDAIDYERTNEKVSYTEKLDSQTVLATCPYFTTNLLHFKGQIEKDVYILNSFVVYMCVEGNAVIKYGDEETETITKGETVLIPAGLDAINIHASEEVKLLEVYIKEE
ncbi:mannose-6-phosphate isomerase [Labilibacter sediminis]|nr:mannose-6-phosphate isomerase [Labilibacter sediminis]